MDWLPRRARKHIFFTPFSPVLAQKKCSCKTAYAIFKVVFQASHIPKIRKIYGRVAKKCSKMHIFTPFSPFLAKKLFFSKIRLRQFLGTIKSYLDTKKQKKLWSRSSGIYPDGRTYGRTYGRTDGRTYEYKSVSYTHLTLPTILRV